MFCQVLSRYLEFLAALVLLTFAGLASNCSNSSVKGLVNQACAYVHEANTYYKESINSSRTQEKTYLYQKSLSLLRSAEPLASQAGSENPSYQALQADLSEISRVPIGNLFPSLMDQCSAYQS